MKHNCITLYAVLARDVVDFAELIEEAETNELKDLYLMLIHPDGNDPELNAIGARMVSGALTERGVNVSELKIPEEAPK